MTPATGDRQWRLAIDFGTSNTAAAYRVGADRPQAVRLSEQADQMPSAVLVSADGVVVGAAAVRGARLDPTAFESCPKRRLGEGEILLGDAEFSVVDLVASVLHQVLVRAMRIAGGGLPTDVVLTFPQQWATPRQDLLLAAAGRAGFSPGTVRLLPEPVAAASWYASAAFGEAEPVPPGKYVAVFDFGGGTLDVAVLRADEQGTGFFRVVAADGIDPLGGEILDLRLQEWLFEQLREGGHRELVADLAMPENLGALQTLREQLRQAKHELSEYESARIPVVVGDRRSVITVTAREFDRLVSADIDSAVELTRRTLQDAGVTVDGLHAMYLTGGSSHLRLVHRRITELLGRSPATLNDPKLVVALGALTVPGGAGRGGRPPTSGHIGGPGRAPAHPVPAARPPGVARPATGPVVPQPGGPPAGHPPVTPPDHVRATPPGSRPVPTPTAEHVGAEPIRAAVAVEPPPRKPLGTAVIITGMAVVAALVVAAVILFTPPKDTSGQAGVLETGSTDSPTSGPTLLPPTPPTPPPTSEPPTSELPVDPGPLNCWDGSAGGDGVTCPALIGQEALEWVFPFKDGAGERTCTAAVPEYGEEEAIEYYACTYADLPHTVVSIGRWTDTEAAVTAVGDAVNDATGAVARPYDNGDKIQTAGVAATVWSGTDQVLDEKRFTFAYVDHPFTLEVVVGEAEEFGTTELNKWDAGAAQFRYADGITYRGSSVGRQP